MSTKLGKLANLVASRIHRRAKSSTPEELLRAIADLWRGFMKAKKISSLQWADDTMKAEAALRKASRNGHLYQCVQAGFLPADAHPFAVPAGAAYFGCYTECKEPTGGRRIMISAPIEIDRSKH